VTTLPLSVSLAQTHSTANGTAEIGDKLVRIDHSHSTLPDLHLTFVEPIAKTLASTSDHRVIYDSVHRLFVECRLLRDSLPTEQWKERIAMMRDSPLLNLIHQDPFTHRAFNKPRGYAGDAVMMDFIYSLEEEWSAPESSDLGQGVFHYTANAAASAGVRARREFIAEQLDEIATTRTNPSVLAIACGHLREVSMSSAVRRRRFQDYLAIDADAESLKEVELSYGRYGIRTDKVDVRKMLTGRLEYGKFDLVYSTGLYDYLNQKTATRLTKHLFSMLKPRGKLVIANFLPSIEDIGYMEAFMDWFLIYRDRIAMVEMTSLIPQADISDLRVSVEENQNIIFLEVNRS
jgi:extracellular factor (EF) 3-hydroxypalmitic acid methyl ester biosynthesis protein